MWHDGICIKFVLYTINTLTKNSVIQVFRGSLFLRGEDLCHS